MTTTNRISNPPQSALLLLLILIAAPALGSTTTCSGSKDVMVVDAFVDIYPAAEPVILATSDGGAAMATLLTSNGNSRILKVNAAAKLQWFVESRVDGGEDFYWYVPKALAESTDETAGVSYLYVAGYTPYTKAFVVKYNMATGTYVSSGFAQKDTSFSQINGLFLDSSGSLVFAGFYGDESSPAVWMGTIDKSTLVGTTQLVVSSYSTLGKVHKVVLGSDGSYVVAGTVDTGGYLWLAAVSGSTWTINWEIECTSASGVASALMEVNSGTYGLLLQGTYYVATSTGIVSSVSVGQISGMQLAPSDSTKLLFAGSTTQSFESVAYIYDPAADCRYDSGETARHDRVRFRGLSRTSSSVSYVWASGYVQDRYATFASLVKLQEVSPLACNSSSTNYLNKACYPSLNSTMCFGLCSACLISDDLNACVAGTFGAHRYAISLFAGRCARPGYHYRASTLSCSPVIQSGCHPLCGGECFLAADATQCAHHCKGISLEPYIDDSELGTNICRCRLGAVYNSDTKKCELVTGCSSMCGTGGCGKSANSAKCANCISSATVTATDSEGYVTCACATNSVLVDGVCKACHAYCNGCTAPADNTKCTACAAIQSIQRRGVSSPYFCSCASDATYDSTTGMCVYTSGCSSHCDKCVTQNNATACIGCASGITSVILNVDGVTSSCACPAAKVFYNGSCVEVLTSSSGVSCHPFCSGACFAPNDATKCAVSCAKSEYYTVTSSVDDQVTCGCASGARLNSAGECVADYQCDAICDTCANSQTCLACPASDGMLLRDGSCICDITEGYALAYDREGEQAGGSSATCIKKVSMVTSSLQYSGDLAVFGFFLTSVLLPGSGAGFWKFMTGMQELMLVATVNMRYHHVSRGLISVFQGASFVNFAIFDPVFLSFSNAFQGEVGYNTFIDYFQYHPSVIGKMFLVNVRCYVCFAIVSLLVFGVGALLAMKYDYFRRLRESYIFSGLYYTVQLGFIDVTLGAIVQFQNFAFSHGPLYTLGNVAACFAFVGEVVFLVGCASLMLAKSKDSLLVPEFRDRYGAIYSDLKTGYTKLHMFTTVFHNCRCFFLVVFMALAYTSPVAQAVGFLMVTLVGLGWDVYFRPYRGRLLTAQVLVLDVCKFAAAIGYIVLAKVKSVDTGDKFSGFVVVVMGLAMGVGVILGIVQQVLGVYQQSKENAVSSIMPDSARPIRSPEGSMSQIGMRHKGSTVGLNS